MGRPLVEAWRSGLGGPRRSVWEARIIVEVTRELNVFLNVAKPLAVVVDPMVEARHGPV